MSAAERSNPRVKFRLSVKLTAAVLVILVTALFFEAIARVVFIYREDIRKSSLFSGVLQRNLILDPYEMPSPEGGYHWVLRPGYQTTIERLLLDKKRAGRELGAQHLLISLNERTILGEDSFRINAAGFKGPELDPSHARPRILALGDSTTFGIGIYDYSRYLETALKRRSIAVEVINGGVEGYFPINVLYELDRYRSLKPEIVTLYIGWNVLFSRIPWAVIVAALVGLFFVVAGCNRDRFAAMVMAGAGGAYLTVASVSYGVWQNWWVAFAWALAALTALAVRSSSPG